MHRLALPLLWSLLGIALGHDAHATDASGMTTMRFVVAPKVRAVTPPAPPYEIVGVKMPPALSDENLETFRRQIATTAERRIYAELAQLVAMQFFWDRDFAGGFDPRLQAAENLAAAIQLEHGGGRGWRALADFAAETTAEASTGRPGIFCAPAEPIFDAEAFDRLLDATRSQPREWAYPRTGNAAVRENPQANASVIDTLAPALVRVLAPSDGGRVDLRTTWARVATPAGQIGFVAPGTLSRLSVERLCYGKDAFGRWRIAGYVGGSN